MAPAPAILSLGLTPQANPLWPPSGRWAVPEASLSIRGLVTFGLVPADLAGVRYLQ